MWLRTWPCVKSCARSTNREDLNLQSSLQPAVIMRGRSPLEFHLFAVVSEAVPDLIDWLKTMPRRLEVSTLRTVGVALRSHPHFHWNKIGLSQRIPSSQS